MKIFLNSHVKTLFITLAAVLFTAILLGQFLAASLAGEYKSNLIAHDSAVAGYLSHSSLDKTGIASAFTAEKTSADTAAGQKLLQAAGYDQNTQTSLLPEAEQLHRKYALVVLGFSILFSAIVLAVLWIFFSAQERKLEAACEAIQSFMDGNTQVRLDDNEEGSLSRLFTAVNGMATSLTAHAQKEKQNKEFLKDTISDISHQLKTPLAALHMYNEIIRGENTGNEVVENFSLRSENELNRMDSLIRNLLKLARLDAGAVELEKSDHNLREFLDKVVQRFAARAEAENKTLSLECGDPITLCCDEDWLMEAVSNIVKNALDHTSARHSIRITGEETPILTCISIQDNGTGIHPEDLHFIFKRFYRSRFSQDQQGAGIGLTLSKMIVEKHGGTILVESEPGKGAVFHLAFPKLTGM